jgi:hypothetical protein
MKALQRLSNMKLCSSQKVSYTWHCSSINREDEPPSYKITIMPLKVLHTLFTNDIRVTSYFLLPLLHRVWPSSRESFSASLRSKPFSFCKSYQLQLTPLLSMHIGKASLLSMHIEVYLKHTCSCQTEG